MKDLPTLLVGLLGLTGFSLSQDVTNEKVPWIGIVLSKAIIANGILANATSRSCEGYKRPNRHHRQWRAGQYE